MRKKRRIILISLLIALLGGFAWLVLNLGEPVYRGRSLGSWLVQYRTNECIDPEAEAAIRAIGRDAIPRLLSMLGTKDTAIRRGLKKLSENFKWLPIHLSEPQHLRELSVCGFIALGPIGKPAMPSLIQYLGNSDPKIRSYAAFCLGKIGSSASTAVPTLIDYLNVTLKNTNGAFRNQELELTVRAFGEIGPAAQLAVPHLLAITNNFGFTGNEVKAALMKIRGDSLEPLIETLKDTTDPTNWTKAAYVCLYLRTNAEPAIPVLIRSLQQTNVQMQGVALMVLHETRARPDLCIPATIPFLQSTNPWIRGNAVDTIRAFGVTSNRLGAAEITKCLSDSEFDVREKAARALKQIDPEAAAKAGIK